MLQEFFQGLGGALEPSFAQELEGTPSSLLYTTPEDPESCDPLDPIAELIPGEPAEHPYVDNSFAGMILRALNYFIQDIKLGARLTYISPEFPTPEDPKRPWAGISDDYTIFTNYIATDKTDLYKKYKSFFVYRTNNGFFANIFTGQQAFVSIKEMITEPDSSVLTNSEGNIISIDRYLENIYELNKKEIMSSLAANEEVKTIFTDYVDVNKLMQFMYINGEMIDTHHNKMAAERFFDTKGIIEISIDAAFAGSDPSACSDLANRSSQNSVFNNVFGGGLSPFTAVGQTFLSKALGDTPKIILKALAELVDPHVIIGKGVKEVSGEVFRSIKDSGLEQMMGFGSGMASVMGNTGQGVQTAAERAAEGAPIRRDCEESGAPMPPLPSSDFSAALPANLKELLEILQNNINRLYPTDDLNFPRILIPQVKESGIEITGTLPYMFAIPPGPLGIAYILFNLAECSEDPTCWPPLVEECDE